MIDKYFRVEVLSQSPNPQQVIYAAMHQDYCEEFSYDNLLWGNSRINNHWCEQPNKDLIFEDEAGEIVLKNLLAGQRGHYGPLEHPQMVINAGWFPHSVMQQTRTHRIGISMDVQSGRYTGQRVFHLGARLIESNGGTWDTNAAIKLGPILLDAIEEVFYLRPLGTYTDRQGKSYEYAEGKRYKHLCQIADAAVSYCIDIQDGLSEEHARGLLPFDIRQHWVLSANVRSLMHLLDLRAKADAQLECQQLCDLIWPHFQSWVPEIADWYKQHRWGKAKLAP
jgi:thymidylate synthase (FAD)